MTTKPPATKPPVTKPPVKQAQLDERCTTGRAICIDKRTDKLYWVIDGNVQYSTAVRFGSAETPTREGAFSINFKSRDHVSTLYHTPMPFAMFFSGGQAVHYSADFAARGYAGASHGCVNVRDKALVQNLFNESRVGDKVIVYRSAK
ncbi:L,D-transpeptidase [Streptomyces sp. SID3343]|uniref:L,D-transpeptidase n=1 Tax=Streptomyces sp. SID3343 TaxID=2690260 RepID=UPI0031F7C13F